MVLIRTVTSCRFINEYHPSGSLFVPALSPDTQRVMSVFPKARHGNPHAGAAAVRLSFLAAKRGNSSLRRRGRENPVLRMLSAPADFRWRESASRLCASLFITRCGRFRSRANPFFPVIAMRLNSTPWTARISISVYLAASANRWLRHITPLLNENIPFDAYVFFLSTNQSGYP